MQLLSGVTILSLECLHSTFSSRSISIQGSGSAPVRSADVGSIMNVMFLFSSHQRRPWLSSLQCTSYTTHAFQQTQFPYTHVSVLTIRLGLCPQISPSVRGLFVNRKLAFSPDHRGIDNSVQQVAHPLNRRPPCFFSD